MISDSEKKYQDSLAWLEVGLRTRIQLAKSVSKISKLLKHTFEAVVNMIQVNYETLGDDADEFAETLCIETSFRILDSIGMGHLLLDLLLVSKYIAGEAAVSYSISGIVDVLDKENRVIRIAAAFMGGLIYLILNQEVSGSDNTKHTP